MASCRADGTEELEPNGQLRDEQKDGDATTVSRAEWESTVEPSVTQENARSVFGLHVLRNVLPKAGQAPFSHGKARCKPSEFSFSFYNELSKALA